MDNNLKNIVRTQFDYTINQTDYNIGKKYQGKVRDVYDLGDKLVILTTDRISAFDQVLGTVPFKGEILNNMSLFWFEKTSDIIKNHIVEKVAENGVLVKKCKILPVEIIVRGYLTGGGWREYCKTGAVSGIKLPVGMKKDTKFEKPILTPTTKAQDGHDMPINMEEIVNRGIINQEIMEQIVDVATRLFERGQEIVSKQGLILVDTKYEFGLLEDGSLILADEIHTSDSSRFWYADTYEERYNAGEEQRMLDKEYLRQYLLSIGYSGDGEKTVIPFEVICGIVERYAEAYKKITGKEYQLKNYDTVAALNKAIETLKK